MTRLMLTLATTAVVARRALGPWGLGYYERSGIRFPRGNGRRL